MRPSFGAADVFCTPYSTFFILLRPLRNHLSLKLASTSKKTPSFIAPAGEEKPKQNFCRSRRFPAPSRGPLSVQT